MNAQGHLEMIQFTREEAARTGKLAMAAADDADLLMAQHNVALRTMDKAIRDSRKADTAETTEPEPAS